MSSEQLYIRGFNHGYMLTKHLPDVVTKFIKQISWGKSDYLDGFVSGKEEYELECNPDQLNDLDSLRNHSKDQERGLELE
jgi:hypothetical protein